MPFITEELWHQLNAVTDNQATQSILLLNFPISNEKYIDNQAEEEMDYIIRLIRSIRNIRQTYNVPHSAQIDIIFQTESRRINLTEKYKTYIEKLTSTTLISQSAENELPTRSATATVDKTNIYVPLAKVIDIEKTKDKLLMRKQSVEKDLQKTKQILESAEFKIKAPAEKVEAVRKQLESTQIQIDHLEAQLKVLN